MRTGVIISGVAHGALVALVVYGLPWFSLREREAVQATEVSLLSEAEFAAIQAAASPEAPRAADAPPELAASPEAAAEPDAPEPEEAPAQPGEPAAVAEPEPEAEAPEPELAETFPESAAEAPSAMSSPDPGGAQPAVVTPGPLAAVAPPRSRPAPRVAPEPTPAPPAAARPAKLPAPETAPAPDPEMVAPEQPAQAPPEAAPDPEVAEPTPEATLALTTSGRPKPRRSNVAAPADRRQASAASDVMQRLKQEVVREAERQRAESAGATPPSEPTTTPATAPAETSLPVGPPLTHGEKDGLRLAVQRCWNVPAGLRDVAELKVTLAAELAVDGQVINASIRLVEPSPPPDLRYQAAFDAGRRALLRCAPYADLPREKYAQWRNIEVVFNPEGMVSW